MCGASLRLSLLLPGFGQGSAVLGALCLVAARLSSLCLPSMRRHPCVSAPSYFKDNNHTGLETIPMKSLESDCICEESASNTIAFTLAGGQGFNVDLWVHNSTHNTAMRLG